MDKKTYKKEIQNLVSQDSRYSEAAYYFLSDALSYTTKKMKRDGRSAAERHISGQELLEGIREFALNQFGPLTRVVLEDWGIYRCEDFGTIVFNMVRSNLLGASEGDSETDFSGGYAFSDVFDTPFECCLSDDSEKLDPII
jgi:uncharacterized repeat protein (TIGR04138 family)